ncbi:c-type cytochrome biogenesis protein CcsB [Dietzia sp.]|uniref:c-type cytochrome biogenesis protein CcsB n=1 Tax=Dietzia sp. TaxID=1871616 RepID=UPI002FD99426
MVDVNTDLARYSDLTFNTAFALLLVGLVVSAFGYARYRVQKVAPKREMAMAGGGSSTTVSSSTSSTEVTEAEAGETSEGPWARLAYLFAALGTVFMAASIVLRGFATSRMPLGNMYEYVVFTLTFAMAISLWFLRKPGYRQLWPWVLLPVLIMMTVAAKSLYTDAAPVMPALQSYWVPIHVTTITLGSGILLLSGLFSIAFLLRSYQEKGKETGVLGAIARPLPSKESIDRMAYYATMIGFPIFGLGIIFGAIWAESAWGRPWGWDPKETVAFVNWIVYAAYLHARATTGWGAKRAAWINCAGLVVNIFNLFFINMVVSGLHSYAGLG